MEPRDIIRLARGIRRNWRTNDPFEIAKRLGIRVLIRDVNLNGFKAQTIQMEGYPTIISINGAYAPFSRKVLCAHELGHAILHEGQSVVNHFDVTSHNVNSNVEYEANLFTLALLGNEKDFNIRFLDMSSAVIKSVLDYNIYLEKTIL